MVGHQKRTVTEIAPANVLELWGNEQDPLSGSGPKTGFIPKSQPARPSSLKQWRRIAIWYAHRSVYFPAAMHPA